MDWRELHLNRRSRIFNFAHRWLKVVAIAAGFPAATICLMALAGQFTGSFKVQAAVGLVLALGVPAIVARVMRPEGDPLVAVGLPSEVYAVLLLGFAVLFVIGLRPRTRPLLIKEGDRAACEGVFEVARAAWFLAGIQSGGAPPCGAQSAR